VDKEMMISKRCVSFVKFILSTLLLTNCALAQCGDCDDKNPCTTDWCEVVTCQHTPQNCDDANSSAWGLFGIGTNMSTAKSAEIPIPNRQDPPVIEEAVNTPLPGESSNAYSVDFLSAVQPKAHNESAEENITINESQSINEEAKLQPICDDGNPCTRDGYDGTICVFTPLNCDDGNDSARISMQSENNSTALSSDEALMTHHTHNCDDSDLCTEDSFNGKTCEHKEKNCDDGDPNTFDYCFEGVCHNTTTKCDDGNPCTIDSFDGTACVNRTINCDDQNACTIDTCKDGKCVHTPRNCDDGDPCTNDKCNSKTGCFSTWKCDDGNPCTVDYCDAVKGCLHSPVVCGWGKTCIDGICQYPYYPYATPYYPYYQPYVAPASALPTTQSYTIPAGTAITLPWAGSVTALNMLKVENGMAYPGPSPLKFIRSLGLEDQAISAYQTGPSISEKAEMIGLSWKDGVFTMTLIQPNGSVLPVQGDNRNVIHLVGPNYDYYFLRSAAQGNWGIEVKPIAPGANGVGFSLITGLVKGAAPINQL